MGIEPTSEAWEASILPLYDARSGTNVAKPIQACKQSAYTATSLLFAAAASPRVGYFFDARWLPSTRGLLSGAFLYARQMPLLLQSFSAALPRRARSCSFTDAGLVAKTGHQVIVDDAGCLHEGVADRRANEAKPALQ
jgi:hypothetical protein